MTRDIAREPCLVHRDPERRVSHVQDHRHHRSRQRLPRSTCPEARCNDLGIFPAPQGRGTGAPENHVIVLFGVTGDLARRKLLPGLFRLAAADVMPGSASAVKAVSVIRTGAVQIHPEQPYGTRKPLYWWLLTSRQWTPPRPINVYVIEHAKRLILFDTGQDRASVTDENYFPGGFTGYLYGRLARFDITESDTLSAQLGYAPADVSTAIVSHPHEDHIGGLPELAGANLLVSAAEWAELSRPAPELRGFLPRHIQLPGLRWHHVSSERAQDASLAPFTESLDLMGDGSLMLLPTPVTRPARSLLDAQEEHDDRSDHIRCGGPSRPPDARQPARAGGYRICRCLDHQRVAGGAEPERGRVRQPGGGRVCRAQRAGPGHVRPRRGRRRDRPGCRDDRGGACRPPLRAGPGRTGRRRLRDRRGSGLLGSWPWAHG